MKCFTSYFLYLQYTTLPNLITGRGEEIIQVNVPNFFHFAEIQKLTKIGPKDRFLGHEVENQN